MSAVWQYWPYGTLACESLVLTADVCSARVGLAGVADEILEQLRLVIKASQKGKGGPIPQPSNDLQQLPDG